jgi:hypothetical protein
MQYFHQYVFSSSTLSTITPSSIDVERIVRYDQDMRIGLFHDDGMTRINEPNLQTL